MKLTKENFKIFGLNKIETQVLDTLLSNKPLNISELSRKSKINRTTILPVLLRFQKRGFARKVHVGKHIEWKAVSLPKIKELMADALNILELIKEKETSFLRQILTGIDTREAGIGVYKGMRQIKKAYETMLDLSKTERVYIIQSKDSARLSLEKLWEGNYLFEFHKKFKKAHIIMEAVAGESILDLFKTLTLKQLDSHKERMLIASLISDKYTNFSVDIMIMRDMVILVNLEDEFAIFIKNKALVEMFKSIFMLYQNNSRKINLNEFIDREILSRKS